MFLGFHVLDVFCSYGLKVLCWYGTVLPFPCISQDNEIVAALAEEIEKGKECEEEGEEEGGESEEGGEEDPPVEVSEEDAPSVLKKPAAVAKATAKAVAKLPAKAKSPAKAVATAKPPAKAAAKTVAKAVAKAAKDGTQKAGTVEVCVHLILMFVVL